MNRLTKKQVEALWAMAQRQLLVNSKLSKALWSILKQKDQPIVDYVDVCKILMITNPDVAEEFIYAMYECPEEPVKVEVWDSVMLYEKNSIDSVLKALDIRGALVDE